MTLISLPRSSCFSLGCRASQSSRAAAVISVGGGGLSFISLSLSIFLLPVQLPFSFIVGENGVFLKLHIHAPSRFPAANVIATAAAAEERVPRSGDSPTSNTFAVMSRDIEVPLFPLKLRAVLLREGVSEHARDTRPV